MTEISNATPLLYRGRYPILDKEIITILKNDFRNTPLYPYIGKLYLFMLAHSFSGLSTWGIKETRDTLIKRVSDCLEVSICLKSIKEGELKGKGWKLSNKSLLLTIYDSVEEYLMDALDSVMETFHDTYIPPIEKAQKTIDDWEKLFCYFPWRESFEYEDITYVKSYSDDDDDNDQREIDTRRLSLSEIDWLIDELKQFKSLAKNLLLDEERPFMHRLIETLLDSGMPKSRKVYRELYRALDNWGIISEDVKRSHECGEPYNDSNYIKSFVTTISKNRKSSK